MSRPAVALVLRPLSPVRTWPVWALRPVLRCYVLAVIGVGAAGAIAAGLVTAWHSSQAVLFGLLMVFCAITVESLRKIGEPAGSIKDAHGVWQLATAVLLPPFYAIAGAIVVFVLTQARVRVTVAYRRVFSTAAIGLSYGASSVLFHSLWRRPYLPVRGPAAVLWVAVAVAAALLRWAVNNCLVLGAVKLDDPAARLGDLLGGTEGLVADLTECSIGVVVAFAAAVTPVMLLLAMPCGTMLQRSSRHRQLVRASRLDSKTGLLTATAWQAEAAVQIARARRREQDLAVLMLDVDRFKAVNDTYGHLAGDAVLVAIAEVLTASVRPYDLAGRFGGEEFCLLLPDTGAREAVQLAERLRARASEITVDIPALLPADRPRITVSVGVAALTTATTDLMDLLSAADAALYRAKTEGRNTVRLAGELEGSHRPGR